VGDAKPNLWHSFNSFVSGREFARRAFGKGTEAKFEFQVSVHVAGGSAGGGERRASRPRDDGTAERLRGYVAEAGRRAGPPSPPLLPEAGKLEAREKGARVEKTQPRLSESEPMGHATPSYEEWIFS